jgi:protease II
MDSKRLEGDKISMQLMVNDYKVHADQLQELVCEEDAAFNIDIGRSKDSKHMLISHQSKTSSEVSVFSLSDHSHMPPSPSPSPSPSSHLSSSQAYSSNGLHLRRNPITLMKRQKDLKYYVDHSDGFFYIATNGLENSSSSAQHNPSLDPNPDPKPTPSIGPMPPSSPSLTASSTSSTILNHKNVSKDLQIIRRESTYISQNKVDKIAHNSDSSFHNWDLIYGNLDGCRSISDFDIFRNKLVVYGRSDGFPSVHVVNLTTPMLTPSSTVDLTPLIREAVGTSEFKIYVGVNAAYDTTHAKFSISHTLLPSKQFSIDLKTGLLSTPKTLKKNKPLKGVRELNWNKQYILKNSMKYRMINRTVLSRDGGEVPMTVVFNDHNGTIDEPLHTPNATVLVGYGAYGMSAPVEYDPQLFALLERGIMNAHMYDEYKV